MSEPREIEAKDADAGHAQRPRDAHGCDRILGAGEAMREEREGLRPVFREIQPARELLPVGTDEIEGLHAHGDSESWSGRSPAGIFRPFQGVKVTGIRSAISSVRSAISGEAVAS
ncbi:MAG TPA: hypothetical protein VH328_01335 [Burkholderiaceae bacterium]|nr:hypothetical protein [Burkholderiaceae bacterium]